MGDGGSAFPCITSGNHVKGMTLRDYFAGQALAGIMACNDLASTPLAEMAYKVAGKMLEERDK